MTQITTRFASPAVSAFLKKAEPGQQNWFLTRGDPQCLSGDFMEAGNFVTKLYPGLRGIIVGKAVDTPEEAIVNAAATKKRLLAEKCEPFDEAAAGVDDEALDLQERFDKGLLRLENIAHIGTMQDGSLAEPLREMIEHLEDARASLIDDLPFLAAFDPEEDIIEILRDHGAVGFLIEASIPTRTRHDDRSASIHYHTRQTEIFYGSTFATACAKALAWAESETNLMMRPDDEPACAVGCLDAGIPNRFDPNRRGFQP